MNADVQLQTLNVHQKLPETTILKFEFAMVFEYQKSSNFIFAFAHEIAMISIFNTFYPIP